MLTAAALLIDVRFEKIDIMSENNMSKTLL